MIAKSFARIHRANLINSGILPLTFINESDYDNVDMGDILVLKDAREQVKSRGPLTIINKTKGSEIKVNLELSERQIEIILAGGLLNFTRKQNL